MNGEVMVGFGYKQAWLAVRDGTSSAVAAVLGLRELGPVPWRAGIDMTYFADDRVAMTPLLAGAADSRWLLATGQWLLRRFEELDVAELSTVLGTEVQAFATHRVVEAHYWQRAVDGSLVRAFGYVGERDEVTRAHGEPDETERRLNLDAETVLVGEGDVMAVAAAWSIDPTSVDGRPAPGPLVMFAADLA